LAEVIGIVNFMYISMFYKTGEVSQPLDEFVGLPKPMYCIFDMLWAETLHIFLVRLDI